jgi:poxvirus D5 protein-like
MAEIRDKSNDASTSVSISITSTESRSEALYEITKGYLNSVDLTNPPTPAMIQNDLLSLIDTNFDLVNSIKAKGKKWKMADALEPFQIAMIVSHLYNVVAIASAGLTSESDYDLIGVYQEDGPKMGIYLTEDRALRILFRKFNRSLTTKQLDEVKAVLKDSIPRVLPTRTKNLVAVNNGIFDYDTKQLLDFSPDYIFTTKSSVNYNPKAKNVIIHNPKDNTDWDVESWMNELSDDPEVVNVLWEMIGAVIRPNVAWNISAWLFSEKGNNGKGTFCELVRQIIGEGNYASISLADFSKDFMLEPLTHSSAIIVDENDVGTYIDRAANLKAVITGDTIQINRKFKQPIAYQFKGFMIQCLNEMPRTKDKSDSFFRRQLFIPFHKCFTGHERKYIKTDYLHRPEVLEYVLQKVLNMNYYNLTVPESCKQAQSEYREYNDPVRQFMAEMFSEFAWDFVPFSFLHDLYASWYKRNYSSEKPQSSPSLIKDILNNLSEYPEWDCKGKSVKVRVGNMMDKPEHLIDEYNLDKWFNPRYRTSQDRDRACSPVPALSYRGIIRQTCVTQDDNDNDTSI